ncbi:Glucosamine-6-phosphate isomerase (Glucosamine-6-phosphate deaminase) (GNPDA) (GlcN6P deaminase) [Mucor velutinosus]|uniref:Glucosamine-6-phosphate isomerase (Glucosamine-6-phosphate deaminase) (GNPDA) (GlcN6P deaminase) n=1 Tax=Mucor velutinosus TaxID=708070 RepID=A0AAN7I2V9_9FUNG|nr:Glucosamine-6-phosphate isomerase (Glucosamine-6-phosphate deaminase) (GNPDA) (GlcN6P deaminase) [Mucor velutinosus]
MLKGSPATEWSVFMTEMAAKNKLRPKEERLSFGELSALTSAEYRVLGENERRRLESVAAAINNAEIPSLLARSEQFEDDMKKMNNNLKYLMTNYNTHAFLITYTDTLHEELYPPGLYSNSAMTTKCVNTVNAKLSTFSIVSCLRRMVLGNSVVRFTEAQRAAPAPHRQTRKRKQLHYPVLPAAVPAAIDLPAFGNQDDSHAEADEAEVTLLVESDVDVDAVNVAFVDVAGNDIDTDTDTNDENEDDQNAEADSEGVFSSYDESDNGDDNDRSYCSGDDDEDEEDINSASRVPDCAPNSKQLPIPAKLRGPSAHSAAITSHAAVITSPATGHEPVRKRTKTDMKKSLQIAVSAAFNEVSRRQYKCVPWLSLFNDAKMRSLGVKMVGWPTGIVPPVRDGKTSFDVYDGDNSMDTLLQGFKDRTIYFEKL